MTKYTPSPEEVEREAEKTFKELNPYDAWKDHSYIHDLYKDIAKHVLIQRYEAAERMRGLLLKAVDEYELNEQLSITRGQAHTIHQIKKAIRNIDPKEVMK